MNNLTDQQLLCDFAGRRSDPAFAELVRRHVDLVYSAALRMVRDAHLAEDVTQGVFVALAQNARQLTDRPVLSGWLHRTAQNLAANTVRSEVRRRTREQEAVLMNEMSSPVPDISWEQIAPQLDAALGALSEPDRDALLLRYFERKSAQEMAGILGISAEAAQKRANRAVEKLRDHFSQRNVTVGAAGLTALMAANSVQAAPAGLAAAISGAAAVAATVTQTSTLIAATKIIAMTTLQKIAAATAFAVVAGAGLYEARQAAQLRGQNVELQQQKATDAALVQQLQSERDDATNRLASLLAENQPRKLSPDRTELVTLRGEVGRLREQLKGLPSSRAALLKQKLEEMPDKKIPELKFLTEQNWIDAAWNADLETDDGVRLALSKLRDESVDTFLNLTRPALKKYLAANDDLLPTDLLPLKPYYDTPVSDEMLRRYAFMQRGKLSANRSESVIRKAVYADPDYDSNQEMSMSGAGGGSFNRFHDLIFNATMDFTIDNNGQTPTESGEIAAYLKRPVDPATLAKYFEEIRANVAANPPPHDMVVMAPVLRAYRAANNGQHPENPSDLLPYAATAEQQAMIQSMEQKQASTK